MLVAIIFVQTFLVEESLRTSKLIFDSAVKQSMEDAVNHLNTDNIKKYLLDTDKSIWQRYKKIDEINDRIKELKTDYPTLFLKCEGYTEKDWKNLSKLSPKDSLALEMYHDLSKKRDMLRDTTFTLDDYAEYFLNFTTKYNVLDISELDYDTLVKMIGEHLKENNIFVSPTVGVLDFSKTKILYVNHPENSKFLASSNYILEYNIGGLRNENVVYISLFFPSAQYFLKTNPYVFLSLTVLMIIVVVLIFLMLLKMIFNQDHLDEMKSNFVNNMNHELKTPISTISLACEMLALPETRKDCETAEPYLKIITAENQRLKGLVEAVLQQSKMVDKMFVLKKETLDLHDIIRKSGENVSLIVNNRKGVVNFKLEAEDSYIFADKLHMTNLVYNLADNAVKYSPDRLEITLGTYETKGAIHFVVSDYGMGIEEESIPHIFDKFYRGTNGNVHNIKEFGIGLSYVKQIVSAHKGKITVTSKVGVGTTFDITLPR
jgi:two-component system phosphate regulon sensor histidine kinase PhoR